MFHLENFKTERLVNVQTDEKARSTHLVMLIKSIYTLLSRKRFPYWVEKRVQNGHSYYNKELPTHDPKSREVIAKD